MGNPFDRFGVSDSELAKHIRESAEVDAAIDDFMAKRNHLFQTLMGDQTDGYYGCPGVGPVTANKILSKTDHYPEMWERVVLAFEKAGRKYDEALMNARMAYILQKHNYDNGEIKLWEPPALIV